MYDRAAAFGRDAGQRLFVWAALTMADYESGSGNILCDYVLVSAALSERILCWNLISREEPSWMCGLRWKRSAS